ncbi:MAG: hypothetical protein LKM36_04370 [Flavobacteriales bacterium]|jgi:hypothetical protein|nr:hypothetical protein [Flavobacteriales bacterium]MBP9161497.1 hypothetical protein [Flavobacteriales bacterium]MCI1752115.1 hypothetical protein [Flavobacteriales bacterium]
MSPTRTAPVPERGPETPAAAKALKASGTVEVLRIKRRSRKHPELLLFKGAPASKRSTVKSALVTLVPSGKKVPTPYLDPENNRLHVFYDDPEHKELVALIAEPGAFLWYFWKSFDGSQSHAWPLRAN